MDVRIESTRIVKPIYDGISPSTLNFIPLSIFDKFTYNTYLAFLLGYRPPAPSNKNIVYGLKKALSEYRELAGRLGEDEKGNPVVLLNDKGAKLIEASVDSEVDHVVPMKPSPVLRILLPSFNDAEELLQIQLTRFSCGSLVVGFKSHHFIADGKAISSFLVAWGKASRGLDMGPLPLHDRTIFIPRDPPQFEFEHSRGVKFIGELVKDYPNEDNITVHRVNFTLDFLSKIKSVANSHNNNPYSTYECLTAHLWRSITKARGVRGFETTHVIVSVDSRMRMIPRVPNEYFGNVVLWAFPSATINDILQQPLAHAAKLVHDAIANVNNNYIKSFIDYATSQANTEDTCPVMKLSNKSVSCPSLEINSWVQFPVDDFDFGGGSPYLFLPSFFPMEGMIYLLRSLKRDGSIDAFVFLFQKNLNTFNQVVYSIDHARSCL